MKKFYLYSFIKEYRSNSNGIKKQKFLVIFYPYKDLSTNPTDIYNQLRSYFQFNVLPDKIIILCASYNEQEITQLFANESEVYNYIPKFSLETDKENISINSLNKTGELKHLDGFIIEEEFMSEIFNRAMVKIFSDKGGLIVSQSAHHFVFPSGKHSDKFLRPGNVLIEGLHINFLAFAVFRHLKGKQINSIFCDTSSINSLAFAYVNLLKEFDPNFTQSVQIESFGSYIGFEKGKFSAPLHSLFLISSSTSGSIIERMTKDKKQVIQKENICILYGLDVEPLYNSNVICDLSFNESYNPEGLNSFESYNVTKGTICKFCEDHSTPVEVKGDVFLLEKPSIKGRLITISDNPAYLKSFANYFTKGPKNESLIKCFYKENSTDTKKYDVFIDIDIILDEFKNRRVGHPFEKIFLKLEKHILQNIPASIKYLVVLPDNSSKALANVIISILKEHGIDFPENQIINIEDIHTINKKGSGSIAVVSTCVITGRNLLYISRALREYEETYRKIYFTFLIRTANKKHSDFLESNLSLGEFGKSTHRMINVEHILCSHEAYKTPWHIEKDFLKILEEFCEQNEISDETIKFCRQRIEVLNDSGNNKGLINDVFFPSPEGKIMKINKGFAFAPAHDDFIETSTQSDIYFIISGILNDLRYNGKLDQSEYVRHLLEPGNFVRFNDGIIQASILRAAKNEELRYDLSHEMSLQIQGIFVDMINHFKDEHAEAFHEFLYAIAIKKLRLNRNVLNYCIDLLYKGNLLKNDSLMLGLVKFIEKKIF